MTKIQMSLYPNTEILLALCEPSATEKDNFWLEKEFQQAKQLSAKCVWIQENQP